MAERVICVSLSDDELRILDALAATSGATRSQVIRAGLVGLYGTKVTGLATTFRSLDGAKVRCTVTSAGRMTVAEDIK